MTKAELQRLLIGAAEMPSTGDADIARMYARIHAQARNNAHTHEDIDTEHPDTLTEPLRPAAVLVLVVNHAAGPTVLFTQRTAHLHDHAGQISFPGGRRDPEDINAIATALRETEEETGVAIEKIQLLGQLPDYITGTGYCVTPIVGWIEPPVAYTPDPFEVAECFEVPLAFLLDEKNHKRESKLYKGKMRSYHAIPFEQRYIWGATAGMLISMFQALNTKMSTKFSTN
jgi:8-oxo-dGTP pyrophosphatase MutT (NUDIX family)